MLIQSRGRALVGVQKASARVNFLCANDPNFLSHAFTPNKQKNCDHCRFVLRRALVVVVVAAVVVVVARKFLCNQNGRRPRSSALFVSLKFFLARHSTSGSRLFVDERQNARAIVPPTF